MIPKVPPKQPKITIKVIQALRAIAALLVVSTHVETAFRESLPTPDPWISRFPTLSGFGGVGVDIFFVISGFIMVYVGVPYFRREGPIQDFLSRRFLRIYPIYWLVSLLLVAAASAKTLLHLFSGQSFAESLDFDLQWYRLLGALSLFPTYNEVGLIQPILGVGWSLSYEIFFYMVFAFAVMIGFRWAPLVVILAFILLIFGPMPIGNSTLSTFLRNPILLEFPLGMLIGYAVVLGKRPTKLLIVLSTILGMVGFLLSVIINFDYTYHYLYWGIPSALLVFGLVFWEIRFGLNIPTFLVKLGDASYSIYLIHVIVIFYGVVPLIKAIPLLQNIPVDLLCIMTFIVSALIGLWLYEKVEYPLQRFLSNRQKVTVSKHLVKSSD